MAVLYIERLFRDIGIRPFDGDEATIKVIIRAFTLGLMLAEKYGNDFEYKTWHWSVLILVSVGDGY